MLAALVGGVREGRRGRRRYSIGPNVSPEFPWVLLDRALLHYRSVLERTHARRDPPTGSALRRGEGLVAELPLDDRCRLDKLFTRIRRTSPPVPSSLTSELREALESLLAMVDPAPRPAA